MSLFTQRKERTYEKAPGAELTGVLSLYRLRSRNLHSLNLASLEAFRAHTQAHILAVDGGTHRLEVREEAALIANMRVRNGITGLRSLARMLRIHEAQSNTQLHNIT